MFLKALKKHNDFLKHPERFVRVVRVAKAAYKVSTRFYKVPGDSISFIRFYEVMSGSVRFYKVLRSSKTLP